MTQADWDRLADKIMGDAHRAGCYDRSCCPEKLEEPAAEPEPMSPEEEETLF